MVNHAPYALMGDIVLAFGKTVKTACGKRVAMSRTVGRDETNCPDCQRAIAADREQSATLRATAENMLATDGCPHCGERFDNLADWARHNATHHREH